MSSEDYLIRQFSLLAKVLAALLGLHEKKNYDQAIQQINEVLDTWYNANPQNLEEGDETDWEGYFATPSLNYETEKAIAELLYQKSITYQLMGNSEMAKKVAKTAYYFFYKIDRISGEFSQEIQLRIAELQRIIEGLKE